MDDYPENTEAAFRAVAPKADIVECDVQRCRSGELVVFHDETVERVTDGSGRVDERDWSRLRELDVHGSGERIPLLDEVLRAVPADTGITVELKAEGIASEVVERVRTVENEVIVSSFYWEELRRSEAAGASSLAVLCHEDPDGALSVADELDADYIHPPKELCIESDIVERAHDRGVKVNVWTGETPEDIVELREAGVDGISVNKVALLERITGR
ncbi:glycerophosphodiester phosphodiesterase [Halobellus marinus]